jgi:hypothetical protein
LQQQIAACDDGIPLLRFRCLSQITNESAPKRKALSTSTINLSHLSTKDERRRAVFFIPSTTKDALSSLVSHEFGHRTHHSWCPRCRFAEGNSHVENGRFFGGDDLEQLACAEDLGADLSLRWPLVLREALYYWPWLRTIGATVVSAIFRNGRWREVANPKCVSKRARVVGSD